MLADISYCRILCVGVCVCVCSLLHGVRGGVGVAQAPCHIMQDAHGAIYRTPVQNNLPKEQTRIIKIVEQISQNCFEPYKA